MLMVTGCSYHIEAKSRWFTYRVYGGSCPIESHDGAGGGADVAHMSAAKAGSNLGETPQTHT